MAGHCFCKQRCGLESSVTKFHHSMISHISDSMVFRIPDSVVALQTA
jgi:hypothetical protein